MNSEDISTSDDNKKNNPARFIAREILNGLETLIQEAQANTRPLEVDPYRSVNDVRVHIHTDDQ
jgi:hypothetical protein